MNPLTFVQAIKDSALPPYSFIVDFDGTITKGGRHTDSLEQLPPPNWNIVKRLRKAHDAGIPIVVYSFRTSPDVQSPGDARRQKALIAAYMKKYRIPYDNIWENEKPFGYVVDDNASNAADLDEIDKQIDKMITRKAKEEKIESSRWKLFRLNVRGWKLRATEAHIQYTDRYGGPENQPDPKTICHGHCEGMGWIPVSMGIMINRKADDVYVEDERDKELIRLWKEAEAEKHAEDGWHFVKCPECGGTGKAKTPADIIYTALGEASMCWDPLPGDQVFDSDKAVEIGKKLGKELGVMANDAKREFGCLMVDAPPELAKDLQSWGKENIPDDILYDDESGKYGREKDSHVTVNFGFVKDPEIADLVSTVRWFQERPIEIRLGKLSKFTPDKYDVIKVEVFSAELGALHDALMASYEIRDDHPEYKAHFTIAYVQKGSCDHLLGNDIFEDREYKLSKFDYSAIDGEHKKFRLGPDPKATLTFIDHLFITSGIEGDLVETKEPMTLLEFVGIKAGANTLGKLTKFWVSPGGVVTQWNDSGVEHARVIKEDQGLEFADALAQGWVRGIIEGSLLVLQLGKGRTVEEVLNQIPKEWLDVDELMVATTTRGQTKVVDVEPNENAKEAWVRTQKHDTVLAFIRADQLTDLYHAAKKSIESDPKWVGWPSSPALAQEYGQLQFDLDQARSEEEIRDIWEKYKPTTPLDSLTREDEGEEGSPGLQD